MSLNLFHSRLGRRAVLAALALGAVTLAAAQITAPAATVSAQSDMAKLRVVHASPDAPAVDVLVDGAAALTNFAYPDATEYLQLPAKTYRVQIAAADNREVVVFDAPLTLEAGKAYTVVAAGLLNGSPAFAPIVLMDDLSNPGADKVRVRFVHASPDAPAVDIAVAGGPTIFSDVAFGQYKDIVVDAGSYDLAVRPTGTTTDVLMVPATLEAGKVYTVLAIGQVGGPQELKALPLAAAAMP